MPLRDMLSSRRLVAMKKPLVPVHTAPNTATASTMEPNLPKAMVATSPVPQAAPPVARWASSLASSSGYGTAMPTESITMAYRSTPQKMATTMMLRAREGSKANSSAAWGTVSKPTNRKGEMAKTSSTQAIMLRLSEKAGLRLATLAVSRVSTPPNRARMPKVSMKARISCRAPAKPIPR